MTTRELWQQIMHYGDFARMPAVHWAQWPETLDRWYDEGLPRDIDSRGGIRAYFGAVPHWASVDIDVGLFPSFEEEVLEETDEYRVFRDSVGVIKKDWKHRSCIPQHTGFTFRTAADWPEFKRRLQPDPARIPDDLDERIRRAEASGYAIAVRGGSMMGWVRNWMGVENMSYLMYDSSDCYAEVIDTISDLVCWGLDQVVPRMHTTPDLCHGWEDICGKAGPLVSPTIFDKCVAPGYTKIRSKLDEHGIKLYSIDTDGDIALLLGHWLDAGVDVHFPVEIGTWQADPMAYRKKYGRELRIVGGFNKLVLEDGPAAIDAEIERRLPLARDGGYILMPDHLITPGVALDDYRYYLDRIRELRF
ncbi:MAG: uroporphyrinogen decarboxylase family protein [Planctomycetota bacterium]